MHSTPKIEDVAKAANVSTATVSRALRGKAGVGDKTRGHILQIAASLGYTPSHSAASLASGSTHTVGLVLPDVSRWFFANTVEAAERTLRDCDYDALIYSLPDYNGIIRPRFDPNVLRSKVDAVAVLSLFFDDDEVRSLKSLNIPAAFLSVRQPGFSHVGIDDERAMTVACEHLIGLNHKTIGHLSGMTNDKCPDAPTQRRRNGWVCTLLAHGLEHSESLDAASAIMNAQNGYDAMNQLLDRRPDVTAVVASSDELAMGGIQALRDRGLQVGKDVSILGIDGHDLDGAFDLTTVSQPVREEGETLIRILLDAVNGNTDIERKIFPTTLIERGSTGPACD